jgi:predicted RNase H-like nuclease (RuvC/YqgF family)
MEQEPTNHPTEEAEPTRIIRQGQRRWGKSSPGTSTGAREAPRIIDTLHHRPQPKPPYFRIPADAQAKLTQAQADAEKARQAIEAIEDRWRSKDRDLAALKSSIYSKEKELNGFRQKLTELDPATLKARFELAYWRRAANFLDSHEMSQWLDVAALRANAPELRKMLTEKISAAELEIVAMEKQRSELEKELGASIE